MLPGKPDEKLHGDNKNLQKTDDKSASENETKLADVDLMGMRRERPKESDVFKPAQVIDYQNKPLRTSRWDDIDIITPTKVVDYGHKKPAVPIAAPPPIEDEYLKPATSIDYGHTSASRKQIDPYDNRRDSRRYDRGYEPPSKRWQDDRGQGNARWNQPDHGENKFQSQYSNPHHQLNQRGDKGNYNQRQNDRRSDGKPSWGGNDNDRSENFESNKHGKYLNYHFIKWMQICINM